MSLVFRVCFVTGCNGQIHRHAGRAKEVIIRILTPTRMEVFESWEKISSNFVCTIQWTKNQGHNISALIVSFKFKVLYRDLSTINWLKNARALLSRRNRRAMARNICVHQFFVLVFLSISPFFPFLWKNNAINRHVLIYSINQWESCARNILPSNSKTSLFRPYRESNQ